MRQHGRASVNSADPRAFGICDRCGFLYNLQEFRWQYQWVGPRQQNIRILVCPSCYDKPQEQLRTFVLPLDPVPMLNARPESYVTDDNPMSGIGVSPNWLMQAYGSMMGNLVYNGGLNAAVDGNTAKPSAVCASNSVSNSSFDNWVGINWQGSVVNLAMPSSLYPPIVKHSLLSFSITAPNDTGFLGLSATDYVIQGSDTPVGWATWTTISSGTTTGAVGETISSTCAANGLYAYHRVAFLGDQANAVAIAQLELNVAQVGEPE